MEGKTPLSRPYSPQRSAAHRRHIWQTLRHIAYFALIVLGALASMATNLAEDPKVEEDRKLQPCQEHQDCVEQDAGLPYCLASYQICVECTADEHCGAQARCFEYRCATLCDSHAQCQGHLACIEGLCRECKDDRQCGDPSLVCYVGPDFNACRPLCQSSTECTGPGYVDGDVCRGGRCQPVTCTVPQDCLVDRELCNPQSGLCEPIVR